MTEPSYSFSIAGKNPLESCTWMIQSQITSKSGIEAVSRISPTGIEMDITSNSLGTFIRDSEMPNKHVSHHSRPLPALVLGGPMNATLTGTAAQFGQGVRGRLAGSLIIRAKTSNHIARSARDRGPSAAFAEIKLDFSPTLGIAG